MEKTLKEMQKEIADSERFPIQKVEEFVVFIDGEPYITGAGLQYKMLQKYGAGRFAVQALPPSVEEYRLLRAMIALKEGDPLVVMKGEVWVEGFEKPFVDYGTASPHNLKGFVKFPEYPIEMATRRATNRAMRLATATGMCSVDEIKEPPWEHTGTRNGGFGSNGNGKTASKEQKDLISKLVEEEVFTEEERQKARNFLRDNPIMRKASRMIDHLKEEIEARKAKKDEGKKEAA